MNLQTNLGILAGSGECNVFLTYSDLVFIEKFLIPQFFENAFCLE
jgi:hypothetical protein